MRIKKSTLYLVGILALVIVGVFFLMNNSSTAKNTISQTANEDSQKITISMKNYNYYPQEIHVKVNQQVEITLDDSVTGCFRDFTIPELGIRKYMKDSQDKLIFTPEEKGRYVFACSMRMGAGTLIVE